MNLVSVIIITRNHSEYLSKCLESVLSQSYKNFEIIIIDHNSLDNTAEIIQSYKSKKLKYFLYKEKENIAAVRNFGIKKSQGD